MTNASATHAFEKWIRMDDATIDKVAHFYTHYMSNIGALTDFNFAGSHASRTDLFFVQALPSAPMWQQLRGNYKSIFGMVAADMQSSIYAFQDVLITGASESFVDTFRIDDEDKRDTITIQHDHQESTAQVELFSLFGATCPTVEPFGAQHPQGAPDYFGGTQEISKGIFADQETLKVWTGNYRAKLNSDYPNVTVPVSPYMKLDSVPQSQVTMSLSPANNPRGLSWVNERFYPHTTTIRYNAKTGVPAVTLTMERFTQGTNAGSLTIPEIQAVGSDPDPDIDDPPDIPTPTGTGQGDGFGTVYVMGTNGLFRTRSFTASPPVWVDITGAATGNGADFILDPFYPTTRGWLATSTGLWRSTDLDQAAPTWTQTMTAAQIFAEMSFSGGYTFHKIARIMGSINKEDYLAVGVSAISGTAYQYGCTVTYDAGTTWSGGAVLGTVQTNLGGDPPYHFFDVVQHLIGGNVRLVGIRSQSSDAKAFYSDNDGVGWTELGAMGGFINQFTPHSVSVPYNGNEAGNIVYFAWGDYRGGTWFAQISKLVSTTATVIHNKSLPATVVGRTQVEAYTQDKDRLAFWSVEQSAPLELHISNDGGATESTVSMTGITGEIRASGGFPYNNSLYYAVTTTGVFVSSDRGSTWTDKTGALSLVTAKGAAVIVPNWTEE
jgi:hypothetical protein